MSALAADRAQIAAAEAKILELQQVIRRSQQRLDSYKYPVLTLPNEIVSEIFIHFIPVYPSCPPFYGLLSPSILTAICRKWREIALSTRALWKAVSLERTTPVSEDISEREVRAVESWLSRSGICPLSITMDEHSIDIAPEMLEAIVPHSARWEHLSLRVYAFDLPMCEGIDTPLLRHLSLQTNDNSYFDASTAFHNAPLLRAVALDQDRYSGMVLPWSQLTSLTLVYISLSECWPILTQTVNLVHCELALCGGDIRPPDVTLPRLESLLLCWYHEREPPLTQFLAALILPALHTLQIAEESLDSVSAITGLISRSGCRLQDVCLTGPLVGATEQDYRAAFPSIAKLSFNRAWRSWEERNEPDSSSESDAD